MSQDDYYDEFGNALEDPATQEAAAADYAAYAGIETETARGDVDLQDHSSILDSQLAQQLGPNYTGEWFSPGSKPIKLGLTSEGYEQTVEHDLDSLGLADNAEIITESASWQKLTEAKATLEASLESTREAGLVGFGLVPEDDAVLVREANDLSSAQKHEVSEAIAAATVPVDIKEEPTAKLVAEPTACAYGSCSPPLRGDVRITSPELPGGGCTAGFLVESLSDARPYVLTAGHCVYVSGGVGKTWSAKDYESGESEAEAKSRTSHLQTIGNAHSYMMGPEDHIPGGTTAHGDAGLIAIENSHFWGEHQLDPLIIQYGNSLFPLTRNETYGIYSTHYNPESTRQQQFLVCMGGVNEGPVGEELPFPSQQAQCGVTQGQQDEAFEIKKTHYKYTVANLETVDVCPQESETDLKAGSSGGPIYKLHVAYGIDIGFEEYPLACNVYYEGINTALSALHVKLVTQPRGG